MKIPLNLGQNGAQSTKAAQDKVIERDVLAAKKGDWNAKTNLARTFLPMMTNLARKRSNDTAQINNYIELGKEGLFRAVKRYKPSMGPERFQIFAVKYIEESMDGKGGGFFARLFGL